MLVWACSESFQNMTLKVFSIVLESPKAHHVCPNSIGNETLTTFIQQVPEHTVFPTQGFTTRPNGSVLSLKNVAVGLAANASLLELHAVLKLPTASILRLIIP